MRKLAIVAVVLLALGLVADRAAAYVAEGVVAQKIEDREGVSDAEVDITGFPFLTQVAFGEFGAIEVLLPSVEADAGGSGSVRVEELEVVFRDVATSDGFSKATAGSLTGSGSIGYDAFEGLGNVDVRYGGSTPSGEGYLQVELDRPLGGPPVSVRVLPTVLDGRSIGFVGTEGTTVIDRLPDLLSSFVLDRYTLAGLPAGFTIDAIEVTPDALDLTVTGSDVPLA